MFNEVVATSSVNATTTANLNYDDSIDSASFYTILVNASPITSSCDKHGVRSFSLISGSTELPIIPQFTSWVNKSTIKFVIDSASGVPMLSSSYKIFYSKQPDATSRGDFQFRNDSTKDTNTSTEDNTNTTFNIPQLELEFGSMPITAKTRKLKAV